MNREFQQYYNSILLYDKPFVSFLCNFFSLKGKTLLDYGCGTGVFAQLFKENSINVSACDVLDTVLEFAKAKTSKEINYFKDDFLNSALEEDKYDFIFCKDMMPLQQIDYTVENSKLLAKIVSSLTENGIMYAEIITKLDGKSSKKYKNYDFETIKKFFNSVGYVSMINVFGNVSVILMKSRNLAEVYNQKMASLIIHTLNGILNYDYMLYLKCRIWLAINCNEMHGRDDYSFIDSYFDDKINHLIGKNSICCVPQINGIEIDMIPYMISAEKERYYEQYYTRQLFKYEIMHFKLKQGLVKLRFR